MRRVQPYKTFNGAARALDNGGRFYNLFTRAGDETVSTAELRRVAAASGGIRGALVFFEMALGELSAEERDRLVSMLEPKLRRELQAAPVEVVEPDAFAGRAQAGRPYIVEGYATQVDTTSAITSFIMIPIQVNNITTFSMLPITEVYDVYHLSGSKGRGSSPPDDAGCTLTLTKSSGVDMTGPIRWGGIAKEQSAGTEKGAPKTLYLDPCCYMPL
ncbi:hypothetical protein ABI59_13370 [Acidobacteria bacterium Mor1]|nr:hypothetical protein ABI59_13370 [Acidobacteria bacterium Mor1]